jgi:hypothetical protein
MNTPQTQNQQQPESENVEEDVKVIDNWQTYIKKTKLTPSTTTLKHTLRPFRRGEKRMETFTNRWNHKMTENEYLTPEYQWNFLQTIDQQSPEWVEFLRSQLRRKLNSYYNQDLKKGIFNSEKAISVDQTIQLILDSFLECYYCHQKVKILYETVRDPLQWTLERMNNEYGHNKENVVISCLQCNLRRRTMNSERYVKTKQLINVKKINDFSEYLSDIPNEG